MSNGPAAVLEVRLVHRVHPGLTLDVALALGRECGVLFGASGAGKTTILRLIAGLTTPDRGSVRLDGATLFDSERRIHRPLRTRRVGMIFQDDLLFPHLDVASNIRFGLKGEPRARAEARLAEVAALCGVEPLLGRRPATLSGGERQRVGLARALAPRPRLLLCDEPVSALDLESRQALVERLGAVARTEAIPVLYVTHNPAEAVALGAQLFFLAGGTIADRGPPLEVLARRSPGGEGEPGSAGTPTLGEVRNVFRATLQGSTGDGRASLVRLEGGPTLVVPFHRAPPGAPLSLSVRAEDILLARGSVAGLSAQNLVAGAVEHVVTHGFEAEVLVRTGALVWIASVVAPAVTSLGLEPGAPVSLVIKARSCHVRPRAD